MGQEQAAASLLETLGGGKVLADIPRIILDIYQMRKEDKQFKERQEYLAALQVTQAKDELKFRLMEEERKDYRHRSIQESPFRRSLEEVRELVLEKTRDGRDPALLIAPFVRDPVDNDKPTYRPSISAYWQRQRWHNFLVSVDGLIVRPLNGGDVDLYVIREALDGIPVVLVHGVIQADRRVWPEVVAWGLMDPPSRQVRVSKGWTPAIRLSLPVIEVVHRADRDAVAADLEVQDHLARMCTLTAGMLGDWFRTTQYGLPPALHKLLSSADDKQLAVRAGVQALDLALEYGQLDDVTAHVEQARICAESELLHLAVEYFDQAITALKKLASGRVSGLVGLQRDLVDTYDMITTKAPGDLAADEMPGLAAERDREVDELRNRLWEHTRDILTFDVGPGER